MTGSQAIVEVRGLNKWYAPPRRGGDAIPALCDVSFDIERGEILGLVGESGSGKTTLGRILMRLAEPSSGHIRFRGEDITCLSRGQLRPLRRHMQLVFQDPYASLNPRMRVGRILSIPLLVHEPQLSKPALRMRIDEVLELVGLFPAAADRYPHEFSGGQRQRIGIARALIAKPEFLVADEAVSALDVSVQAQIVNLLLDLRQQLGLTILFIAHDLAVVGAISDRIAVLYRGRIVEIAETRALFTAPSHPYTEALLSSIPGASTQGRIILRSNTAIGIVTGCAFRDRCHYAEPACAEAIPLLQPVGDRHWKACHRADLALTAPLNPRPS